METKRSRWGLIGRTGTVFASLLLVLVLGGCGPETGSLIGEEADLSLLEGQPVTVHFSSTCGCCGEYVEYLQSHGLEVKQVRDRAERHAGVQREHGITNRTRSCHTSVVGEYAVEGHVPVSVIAKLLEDQPDLAAVTIPGMPQHAPGMGGPVGETLEVYSIDQEGQPAGVYASVQY